jgi:F0F1-type ATP synthase assembly protein I
VQWAERISAISLEFALPPLGGGYLDRRWGTGSLFTIIGAVLGFLVGMMHLMRIAQKSQREMKPFTRKTTSDVDDRSRTEPDDSHEAR